MYGEIEILIGFVLLIERKNHRNYMYVLDYILANQGIMAQIDTVDILPAFKSDHGAVVIKIGLAKSNKHRGLWKFNNSLLQDQTYMKHILEEINRTKCNSRQRGLNPIFTWESLKSIIIQCTKKYAKERSVRLSKDFAFMQQRLTKLLSEFNEEENESIKKTKRYSDCRV